MPTDDPAVPTSEPVPAELVAAAEAWMAGDPDPATRAALQGLLDAGEADVLADHVARRLQFGTAGLRGAVGPGPNRMNRATVIRATRGLADHLLERVPDAAARGVVVGFDARPDSPRFADDVVAVLVAAGLPVRVFGEPTPTPIVAWAARRWGAAGAVVVTASHNPPRDNGYKVYDEHAVQITSPTDQQIAACIDRVGPAAHVPGVDTVPSDGVEVLGPEVGAAYLDAIMAVRPAVEGDRGVPLVLTPMHGVGGRWVEEALHRAGHAAVHRVEEQWQPDGRFPTVAFPNPEEPGALDLAFTRADAIGADVVLANDPDADRLAVAVRDDRGWRRLAGDEVGVLLADHLLGLAEVPRPVVVSSIVSSERAAVVAASHGARHEQTLTGFKWIWRAGRALQAEGHTFVLGYEEALGYSVGDVVRDKDGIAAAVVVADLVAQLAARGRTLVDRLAELDATHGAWVNVQRSVVRTGARGAAEIAEAVARAGARPPSALAGRPVVEVVDLQEGAEQRPPWLPADAVVVWRLGGGGRVLVRPSGTEPKCKVYVDVPLRASDDEDLGDRIADEAVAAIGLA